MTQITINNLTQRIYTLEEIKERTHSAIRVNEGADAPFSYASYAGSLEAHYILLKEYVERIAEMEKQAH